MTGDGQGAGRGGRGVTRRAGAVLGVTKDFGKFDDEFAVTNVLRARGTDYLLEAACRAFGPY